MRTRPGEITIFVLFCLVLRKKGLLEKVFMLPPYPAIRDQSQGTYLISALLHKSCNKKQVSADSEKI